MMDRSAIEYLISLSSPNLVERNGVTYSDKDLSVIERPTVVPIKVKSLQGIIDLINNEWQDLRCPLIVQVIDHRNIAVMSSIRDDRTREALCIAEADLPSFSFNNSVDYETMMVALKSKFVETSELLEVVQLLGTITEENNRSIADDGFTQTVVVKKGIALKDNKVVKPIVRLKPYRTFLEVDQPESEFLLRLYDGGRVALHEADGGAWKLIARKNIAMYLSEKLSNLISENKAYIVA